MAETSPTQRQLEVLRTIASLSSAKGYAPTIRELGDALDISSTNAMNDHLKALVKKGLVTRDRLKARSILITAAGWRWLPAEAA